MHGHVLTFMHIKDVSNVAILLSLVPSRVHDLNDRFGQEAHREIGDGPDHVFARFRPQGTQRRVTPSEVPLKKVLVRDRRRGATDDQRNEASLKRPAQHQRCRTSAL